MASARQTETSGAAINGPVLLFRAAPTRPVALILRPAGLRVWIWKVHEMMHAQTTPPRPAFGHVEPFLVVPRQTWRTVRVDRSQPAAAHSCRRGRARRSMTTVVTQNQLHRTSYTELLALAEVMLTVQGCECVKPSALSLLRCATLRWYPPSRVGEP